MIIEARGDTITLRGAVKSNIWAAIQAAAALLLENHPTGIIIDCTPLTKITAEGAETFENAFGYIASQNARIVVAGLRPDLQKIGQAVPGVRSQLPIAETVEDARASLALEEVTPARGKAREAGMVPILGNWRRSVYLGSKLAMGENCELHLVDLLKVPRTLPMGSPLPERETHGKARLDEAAAMVKATKLSSYTHVERVRSKSAGLADFMKTLNADFTIVSIDRPEKDAPNIDENEALSLLETADFDISVIKGSPVNPQRPPKRIAVPAVGEWEHALDHACKLALGEDTIVTLVSIIVVHRSQAIDAPAPDAESAASDAAKQADLIGKKYMINVNKEIDRVRDPVLGFNKFLETNRYDLTIIGVRNETDEGYSTARSLALGILSELPCETIFLKSPEGAKV